MADLFSLAPRTLNLEVGMSSKRNGLRSCSGLALGKAVPGDYPQDHMERGRCAGRAYLYRSFALERRAALSQSPSHCVTDYLPREGLREEISYTKLLRSQRDGTWVITGEKNDWSLTSF